MSLELGTQSQNHVIRSFVRHRCCSELPFADTASGGDLFSLPDVVELQRAVVASHVRRSVFRNGGLSSTLRRASSVIRSGP